MRYIFFLIIIIIFSSCSKVIDVDLNEADPQIVVDAFVESYYDKQSIKHQHAFVKLSYTSSFFENNTPVYIDGAKLHITNNKGDKYLLDDLGKGRYSYNFPDVNISASWKIEGLVDDTEIEASAAVPSYVGIDSVVAIELPFGPPKKGRSPICFFTDKVGESNSYRLKIKINGVQQAGLYITRDDGQDGKQIAYPFMRNKVFPGDTIDVLLLSIDKFSLDYYLVFAQNMGGGGFSAAPGNPISNIEGENTIGIFTGQTRSEVRFIVK